MVDEVFVDFARIARELHGQDGVEATAGMVAELARRELGAEHAGVMLVRRGRRVETAAVTGEVVVTADELQLSSGVGPCLEAMAADSAFVVTDTRTDDRWVPWCRAVADLGIVSVLSVRLFTARGVLGCLNVYSDRAGRFGDEHLRLGGILAGHASVAVATERTKEELREAMEGRHVIGIAQGMLMERFKLDKEQAFSVLRRYSQDHNTKLRAVAQSVATTGRLPDRSEPEPAP